MTFVSISLCFVSEGIAQTGGTSEDFAQAADVASGDYAQAADIASVAFAQAAGVASGAYALAAGVASGDYAQATDVARKAFAQAAGVASGDYAQAADVVRKAFAQAADVASGDYAQAADVASGDYAQAAGVARKAFAQAADVASGAFAQAADVASGDYAQAADVASGAFAQAADVASVAFARASVNVVGRAYEYSGLTKYFAIPAKVIFGDRSLAGADIVAGYRVNPTQEEIPDCLNQQNKLILQSTNVSWWQQPSYVLANSPLEGEEFIILPHSNPEVITNEGCLSENYSVDNIQLVADESIVNWIRESRQSISP